jgi:hypothetical protein
MSWFEVSAVAGRFVAPMIAASCFQRQVCQDRIEIDRNSPSTKGVVAVKIDMPPGGRKDLLQKGQSFGIFARLILSRRRERIAEL